MIDHAAFARDDKGMRNPRRASFSLGSVQERRLQPAIVVSDGVIGADFLEKFDDSALLAFLVVSQTDNLHSLIAILFAQVGEFRNESDARRAVALPEINDENLAAKIG